MPNIEQQQQTKSNYNTIISNIEQQEQTKTNYNIKYLKTEINKNQLQCQIWNSSKKIKNNYNVKYRTAATNKNQL